MFQRSRTAVIHSIIAALIATGVAGPALAADAKPLILLERKPVKDQVAEMDAMHVVLPKGWHLRGAVSYNQVPSLAIVSVFAAVSPEGETGAETYGAEPRLVWLENPLVNVPEGELYYGNPIEKLKSAADYMKARFVADMTKKFPDYKVVELKQEKELIAALTKLDTSIGTIKQLGGNVVYDAISLRATYKVNNKQVEEELLAAFRYTVGEVGQMKTTNWGPIWHERLWAPKGELDKQRPMLRAIARGAKPNPKWVIAVNDHRYKIWGIASTGQKAMDEYILNRKTTMRKRDEAYKDFSYYLRGTDVKVNPIDGEYWELPDQAKHTWFAEDGRILQTDREGYNPNEDREVGGQWRAAERPR